MIDAKRYAAVKDLPVCYSDQDVERDIEQVSNVQANQLDEYQQTELARDLHYWLQLLSKEQAQIIIRRFGLYGSSEMSLEEISKELGISREKVRRLQQAAMNVIRKASLAKGYANVFAR